MLVGVLLYLSHLWRVAAQGFTHAGVDGMAGVGECAGSQCTETA